MGAVTALLYGAKDPRIRCIAADSPFSNLKQLSLEMAKQHSSAPTFLLKFFMTFIKRSIRKMANFNIQDLDIVKAVQQCQMPSILVTSKEDTFISSQHVEKLYNNYLGEKHIRYVQGDHNAMRPQEFYKEIASMFQQYFNSPYIPKKPINKKQKVGCFGGCFSKNNKMKYKEDVQENILEIEQKTIKRNHSDQDISAFREIHGAENIQQNKTKTYNKSFSVENNIKFQANNQENQIKIINQQYV